MKKKLLTVGLLTVVLLLTNISRVLATDWPTVVLPTITSTNVFNITDATYGASATSNDNTAAIQAALDACGKAGGGKVIVPAGTFLCGPISMSSKTNLYLSEGATLQLLPYGTYPTTTTSTSTNIVYPDFITCSANASNLKISGKGRIYGNGNAWWTAYDNRATGVSMKRGAVIRLNKASNIEIDSITINDAPGSHITIGMNGNSNNATIHNIRIDTQVPSHNTDGIDIWGTNVNIDSCYISDGDDNIAIDKNSQYIKITNSTFGYGHGTSVGSYTTNVKHVLIDNCKYTGTDNGIRLKSNNDRGGGEEDFMFSNLTMSGVNYTFYIDCYYDKDYTTPANDKTNAKDSISTTPSFKDIYLKNITSTAATNKKYNAIFIYGRPECHVKNITLDNVKISAPYGMIINFADHVKFINGTKITVASGNEYVSKYDADITENDDTAIDNITGSSDGNSDYIYSINGTMIKRNANADDIKYLPKGVYIIGNKTQLIQ